MKEIKVLFSEEEISKRVHEIAAEVNKYVGDEEVVVIANLKGAVPFYTDLFRRLTGKVKMDFIETQSYEDNKSSGHVKISRDLSEDVQGKKIIVVEDILDTGLTFEHLLSHIRHFHKPAEIKICVLLSKKANRKVDIHADWVGFEIPNHFVVGYGFDDNQFLRNLPYIGYFE
ncbi:MAG: hypoxanthine phosphoribosyltransferase [Brevinema sp.]